MWHITRPYWPTVNQKEKNMFLISYFNILYFFLYRIYLSIEMKLQKSSSVDSVVLDPTEVGEVIWETVFRVAEILSDWLSSSFFHWRTLGEAVLGCFTKWQYFLMYVFFQKNHVFRRIFSEMRLKNLIFWKKNMQKL